MLISFIGSPASGKTTIAALLFARLKESGLPVEFIAEQARYYIAKKKVQEGTDLIHLDDQDQFNIYTQQMFLENLMKKTCNKDTIIITDTSALNALVYMTSSWRDKLFKNKNFEEEYSLSEDKFFYTYPIGTTLNIKDANRVHSVEESTQIDQQIPQVIQTYFPALFTKMVGLVGGIQDRLNVVLLHLYTNNVDN